MTFTEENLFSQMVLKNKLTFGPMVFNLLFDEDPDDALARAKTVSPSTSSVPSSASTIP